MDNLDNFQDIDQLDTFDVIDDNDSIIETPIMAESQECEIALCNEQHFKDVQTLLEENHESFEIWWPAIAKQIIHAMYTTKEDQKCAAKVVIDLMQLQPQPVDGLVLPTPDMIELKDLYKHKVVQYEEHINLIQELWCEVISSLSHTCKNFMHTRQENLEKLAAKASQLEKRYPKFLHIIKSEMQSSKKHIEKDFTVNMKLAKSDLNFPIACKMKQDANLRLSELQSALGENAKPIHDSYLKELQNADVRIVQKIMLSIGNVIEEALKS